jgi:phosphohistidine swiveling domain-containing protein
MRLKPKYLFDKDPWMLAEDIPDGDIFFFQIPMSAFASDTSYKFLKNYKKVLTHYKKFHMGFYFGEHDSFEVGEKIVDALFTRPGFGKDINQNVIKWSQKLIDFAKKTAALPLRTYSNKELWQLYLENDTIHTKLYTYGWLPVACDMFHNNLTSRLKKYLYTVCDDKAQAESAFIALTTPNKKSIIALEREEFLKIHSIYISNNRLVDAKIQGTLDRHSEKWGHLGYIFSGNAKPFSPQHYLNEMRELEKSGFKAKDLLEKEARQLKRVKKDQLRLYKKLKIDPRYRRVFEVGAEFASTKLFRRHAQLLNIYLLHKSLLTEIAKRLGLTRYQVQFMVSDEVRQGLLTGKGIAKPVLDQRLRECVLYTEKDFERVYIGKDLKKITKNIKVTIKPGQTEVVGQTAQPGHAKGRVKIIIRAADMKKFMKGDILVSIATDPDIVPAMKRAAAIVTEQGGITSHAAIVSRELGIPCVIGTKIATKVFKDGDMVEVDADRGIVKKLSK